VIFGHVFDSPSKPGLAPAGLRLLETVVRATTVPVLAVGGVSPERGEDVAATGAAGVAGIRLFADPPLTAIPAIVEEIRAAFDRSRSVP